MRTEETQTSLATATRQESSHATLNRAYTPAVELPAYLGRAADFEWFLIPRSKTQQGAVLACADSPGGSNQ